MKAPKLVPVEAGFSDYSEVTRIMPDDLKFKLPRSWVMASPDAAQLMMERLKFRRSDVPPCSNKVWFAGVLMQVPGWENRKNLRLYVNPWLTPGTIWTYRQHPLYWLIRKLAGIKRMVCRWWRGHAE